MDCVCGHSFAKEVLERLRNPQGNESGSNDCDGFLLVRNRDYQAFLASEQRVLNAESESERLRCVSESAQYAGNVMVCPQCSRIVVATATSEEDGLSGSYRRED